MDYETSCTKLTELIQTGHYEYIEEAGLAIQTHNKCIADGDDPAMALAMAKTLETAHNTQGVFNSMRNILYDNS